MMDKGRDAMEEAFKIFGDGLEKAAEEAVDASMAIYEEAPDSLRRVWLIKSGLGVSAEDQEIREHFDFLELTDGLEESLLLLKGGV